jgi:hypothetical protein
MVWIIFQNISKIVSLDFANFFNTTAFYPNPYSLLFSDLLLPQSIMALPFYLITKNLILTFNLVFILTFILNYFSLFLFWRIIFKNNILAFLGAVLFIFSPFFHLNISHFQMLSYWPFFFSLYFLFKTAENRSLKTYALCGLFVTVQFLSSVYLSVYLLTAISIYFFVKFLNRKNLNIQVSGVLIILVTFIVTSGIFIKGYFDMKNYYDVQRDIGEYITYSASLSDYVFSFSVNSLLYNLSPLEKWNSFNKNGWGGHAAFPGFLIIILSTIGLFSIKREKLGLSLFMTLDWNKAFFLTTALTGFIFSLGPRLNFNGTYAQIPLPYTIIMKIVPLFESVRVSARWSYLLYFGLIFFSLIGLQKLAKGRNSNVIYVLVFMFLILEFIPLNLKSTAESYYDDRTFTVQDLCLNQKKMLLEIPVTHLEAGNNIAEGLSYITKSQLSSTVHNCPMFNGYSGYDLPSISELSQKVNLNIEQNNSEQFVTLMREKGIGIVKFNPESFTPLKQPALQTFLTTLTKTAGIEQIETTIFVIKGN